MFFESNYRYSMLNISNLGITNIFSQHKNQSKSNKVFNEIER